ncbi:hypothetical protein [Amycolatopsis sp. NPDC004625]|uniref:hypothetical protein n=1 Tax=Amycolatopsis sp. NPDC004625 TaxID=3154670 RepID=UPI0033A9A032
MPGIPPHVLVIFGATGDLAKRLLVPGVVQMWRDGGLPDSFRVIGTGRTSPGSDREFRAALGRDVREFGDVDTAHLGRIRRPPLVRGVRQRRR